VRTLQTNLAVFLKALPSLLPEHEGMYVMICHGHAYPFKTAELATKAGLELCENAHEFLVLKIERLPTDLNSEGALARSGIHGGLRIAHG